MKCDNGNPKTMKTNCSLLVAFAIGVSMISVRATPITSLFNTGVDSSGAVLPDGTVSDPHYRIVYSPSGSANIRVRSSAGGWAPSPFTGDDDSSRWIGPNTRSFWEGEEGLWIYRTTFYLTDGPPSAASIVGRIGVDPELEDIQLNGHSLDISVEFGNQAFESWQPFTINRHFVSGENRFLATFRGWDMKEG